MYARKTSQDLRDESLLAAKYEGDERADQKFMEEFSDAMALTDEEIQAQIVAMDAARKPTEEELLEKRFQDEEVKRQCREISAFLNGESKTWPKLPPLKWGA